MKHRTIPLTLLIVTCLLLTACGVTPSTRWAQARVSLTTTQNIILDMHEVGLVDDKTLIRADAVRKPVKAGLDKAATFLPEGGDGFEHWMAIVFAGLSELDELQTQWSLTND